MNFKEWLELNEIKDACYHKVKSRYKKWPSAYASGALVKCRKVGANNWGNSTNENSDLQEGTFDLEKKRGLKGWFDRNKGKGWIDCKASKKGNLVPTLSACNKVGVRRKKSGKAISWEKKK
jgi:hypothetical protein